jgi:hypothetical protein
MNTIHPTQAVLLSALLRLPHVVIFQPQPDGANALDHCELDMLTINPKLLVLEKALTRDRDSHYQRLRPRTQNRTSSPRTRLWSNKPQRDLHGITTIKRHELKHELEDSHRIRKRAMETRTLRTAHGGIIQPLDGKTPVMIRLEVTPDGYAYVVVN